MPALATLRKERGEATARAVLVLILNDMLDFFNAGNDMNDTQVALTVDLILEEYPYMQTDDITLCFRNAMKGKYGKLYNRIDGQIIMGWLKEYNKERCAEADRISYNGHKERLSEESRPVEGLFYAEYRSLLEQKAMNGDKQAVEALRVSDTLTEELERRRRDSAREDLERFYQRQEAGKTSWKQDNEEKYGRNNH